MRRYLTTAETAENLGLTTAALYMRVHRRTIPYVKLGKALRFDPRRIEAMMDAHTQEVLDASPHPS